MIKRMETNYKKYQSFFLSFSGFFPRKKIKVSQSTQRLSSVLLTEILFWRLYIYNRQKILYCSFHFQTFKWCYTFFEGKFIFLKRKNFIFHTFTISSQYWLIKGKIISFELKCYWSKIFFFVQYGIKRNKI